jgi:glyoxylase-like metal-dependent hydrolase (beta-lactamase superfamily II)
MECGHMTTLFVGELNSLLTSDICYNGVHAWAGQGVEREHIGNWLRILAKLDARFAGSGVRLYPGHGESGDIALFEAMRTYLDDFLAAVDEETSNAAAMARMIRLYPSHHQADFLLQASIAFHGPDR